MPNRMLRESIRTSETLALLTGDEERHFFRLVVQADDFGCFDAREHVIRANSYAPMLDRVDAAESERRTKRLAEVGLITLYEYQGRRFGHFMTWSRHQQRRANVRKFPEPPTVASASTQPTSVAGSRPQLLAIASNGLQPHSESESESRNEKRETKAVAESPNPPSPPPAKEPAAAAASISIHRSNGHRLPEALKGGSGLSEADAYVKEVASLYSAEIGLVTPHISNLICDLLQWDTPPPIERVRYAFGEAVKHNKRQWSYIEAILKNSNGNGRSNGYRKNGYSDEHPGLSAKTAPNGFYRGDEVETGVPP